MASPPRTPRHGAGGEGAVCCMCGDHGLTEELFRCRGCRARLQHTYCSDLYPRAAAYRRCNWCLRAPAPGAEQGGRPGHAAVAAGKTEELRRKTAGSSDVERGGCSPMGSRSPPELGGRPVKKKHKAEEKAPTPTRTPAAAAGEEEGKEEVVARDAASGAGSKAEVMRAGKTTRPPVNRVKVRRYKLLAEVISC
ncbi:hypothetical protein U9M48_032730 [Paspalum notatum var. saurae]|uniref:PHD-type zinc finger plants domain-containing protein n=1 Tax=Paspalum notatum var. saurae TaxID=547442 RepID=A0AAQ3X629_PASNO